MAAGKFPDPRYRLGVDVGGTHTDLVLLEATTGTLTVEKVASTPGNPALGVLSGIARFVARGVRAKDIEFFAHGTTITTNALLEMRGAKVGLLITKGYRAVQEVQNQARDRQHPGGNGVIHAPGARALGQRHSLRQRENGIAGGASSKLKANSDSGRICYNSRLKTRP